MANIPDDLHYSKDHEWVRVEGNTAVVGITDYAQDSLGDVVYEIAGSLAWVSTRSIWQL